MFIQNLGAERHKRGTITNLELFYLSFRPDSEGQLDEQLELPEHHLCVRQKGTRAAATIFRFKVLPP